MISSYMEYSFFRSMIKFDFFSDYRSLAIAISVTTLCLLFLLFLLILLARRRKNKKRWAFSFQFCCCVSLYFNLNRAVFSQSIFNFPLNFNFRFLFSSNRHGFDHTLNFVIDPKMRARPVNCPDQATPSGFEKTEFARIPPEFFYSIDDNEAI